MSFHGALIGIILGTYRFSLKKNIPTFLLLDIIDFVAPIGIFFGRIANFINGELAGKTTDVFWGVIFPKIDNYISLLSTSSIFGKEIITEVKKIDKFYYAEEYHQDYEKKNPYNPYVQNVSIPRFNRFKQKASSYIKIKDDH